jgi:hypothetical protein
MRASLAGCALLACACGVAVDEDSPADPLPSEFVFEYLSISLAGTGEPSSADPPAFTARFDAAREFGESGLYPVQYGIGYFYPVEGGLAVELSDCEEEDSGFYDRTCVARLTAWRLTVTPRADYPNAFMDGATFTAVPASGTAHRSVLDGTYDLSVQAATVLAETRTGASSSEYHGELGLTLGEAVELRALLAK